MRKVIIALGAIGLVCLVGYLIYLNTGFKVLSMNPSKNDQKVSIYDDIEINFNKDLAPPSKQKFYISPSTEGDIEIKNGSFKFTPKGNLKVDKEYTITLKAVAKDGRTANIEYRFKVAYQDYKDLSSEEKKKGLEQTDRLEERFPITRILPYEKVDYKIDYEVVDDALVLKIETFAFIDEGRVEEYKANTARQRQEALDYIRSQGHDPAKYKIEYTPAN